MPEPSSPRATSDRNLLFGILALQNDFISRDQLLEAMNAWMLAKERPLGDLLRERGLGHEEHALLEALVARQLARHGGDAERSLQALSTAWPAQRVLAGVQDPDVQASLAQVGFHPDDATALPETPAGDGPRYRILRPHARGGLGEVFVAEDTELHREVALKEIQLRHADDAQSRGRFLLEAEITGRLEHPGIVPVYGLGTYADGRPFYAMRFIRGDNLKRAIEGFHKNSNADYAEERREDLRDNPRNLRLDFSSVEFRRLLGRFLDVCNAVAYAHSRGVLHRDLKPGNVMLGEFGETLLVDWGLAKIVGRPVASDDAPGASETNDPTLRPVSGSGVAETAAGSLVGTPAYMSPEQAEGKLDQLGPVTDIYSLGATLYCLLTGRQPIAQGEAAEMLERVRRGDILPPQHVRPGVPKALAAICLKAMSVRPGDRYPTASALAADVEHWLADEPVRAYGEPWLARVGRWARRHRTLVTSTAAVLVVATLGAAAAVMLLARANAKLEAARKESETNELTAKERYAETKAVLEFVEDKVFAAARPEGKEGGLGSKVTLRRAVEEALPFVEKSFPKQPLIEARVRMTLGASFEYLGDAKTALGQFQRARTLYTQHFGPDDPDTLKSMNNLAVSYDDLGRHAEAMNLHEETLALRKAKLGPDHLDTLASMNNLAISHENLGQHADALKLREEVLALRKAKLGPDHPDTLWGMNNLANSYADLGRYAEAMKLHEETLALRKAKLGTDHPDTLASMHNLANSYADLGRRAEALKLREEALALRKSKLGADHPDTLSSMQTLANSYADLGRRAEALKLREETLALSKATLGPDHPDTLASMGNLANSYALLGRHAEALKLKQETFALRKAKLGPDHPNTLRTMNNLANSYAALGQHVEALHLREEALALRKAKQGPDHPDTLWSMWGLSESLVQLDRGPEAVPIIDECLTRAVGKVVDPSLIPGLMNLRLRHFTKSMDAAGCRATAEMWEKLKRTDASSLYDAACLRAVTAAVIGKDAKTPVADATRLAKEEADRAMAWLKQAVAAGYKNVAHMKKDTDLNPLRQRADFQKLLAELEAGGNGQAPEKKQ